MILAGTLLMGFWLYLVGGLQGRFGNWGSIDGSRMSPAIHCTLFPHLLSQQYGLSRTMALLPKPSSFVPTSLFAGMLTN